jgi:hypothetical protein
VHKFLNKTNAQDAEKINGDKYFDTEEVLNYITTSFTPQDSWLARICIAHVDEIPKLNRQRKANPFTWCPEALLQ